MSVSERRRDHFVAKCPSKRNCAQCGQRHHIHLHESANPSSPATDTAPESTVMSHVARLPQRRMCLSSAVVKVKNRNGNFVELRALIDKGSEASMITERAAKWLNLPTSRTQANITGLSDAPADSCNQFMQLSVHSTTSGYSMDVYAFVMRNICSVIPSRALGTVDWDHISDLDLADPHFSVPAKIDLLLGTEVYGEKVLEGLRKSPGLPTAQNTEFGWILIWAINLQTDPVVTLRSMVSKVNIDNRLRRFWEIENISETRDPKPEEQWCEQFYQETLTTTSDGRYSVRLPFKTYTDESAILGKSRQIAVNQFCQLERRFTRDRSYYEAYSRTFRELLAEDQMELAPSSEATLTSHANGVLKVQGCYLPHHAVLKEDSTTTQLRVVFDASRKTSNGNSLNEILHSGPALQNDLPSMITNWRFHRIAFSGDLKKMFLQIRVHPDDAQFQRVVWRDNPNEPIRDYTLKVVTFGETCAPFLAIRTVIQLANDFRDKYPLAYHFLIHSIYVDNLFGGSDHTDSALELQQQLIDIFHERGFHLRKWVSNDEAILNAVPPEDREIQLPLSLTKDDAVKALGIYWQPKEDSFRFQFNFDISQASIVPITKRSILSTIARLYDPPGLITPVIMPAKILIRELWIAKLEWDEIILGKLAERWKVFVHELSFLPQLRIPRWLNSNSNYNSLEIHGFSDASQDAYAASIYLRVVGKDNRIHCHLLASKTKIAPADPVSIPRLELLGAELLSILISHTLKHWTVTAVPPVHAWTDSQVLLHWLRGDSNRWEIFVANRVNKIKKIIPFEQWHHVASEDNPADVASRGLTPREIIDHHLWWNGPKFLHSEAESWPQSLSSDNDFDGLGLRQVHMLQVDNSSSLELLEKFSSFSRLIRVTAIIQIFAQKARKANVNSVPLNVQNLSAATNLWVSIVQANSYREEIHALKNQKPIPKSSKLLSLNPFLDSNQILRVRGRLENSNRSYEGKFPIILPPKGHFTTLLIRETHSNTLHGGVKLVLAWLSKKYWVVNARNAVRYVLGKCVTCYRLKASASQQLMAPLPAPRVQQSLPFTHTGVDFAGPLQVKASNCRGKVTYKGYIAIFVCFSTKAIHTELVGDMETPTFLAALKRFLARRNACAHIHSDNGKTFVGATNKLRAQEQVWKKSIEASVLPFLTNRGISWHFIPPHAPEFGGLWEAGVKSIKYHLHRVCRNLKYSFEEWTTLLTEIEGILNSRPLCPFTADPDDLTAITPNHFLNGDITRDLPEPDVTSHRIPYPKRLRELIQMKQSFWRQWNREYLNQLQSRPKWLRSQSNLQINDMVLIKDENLPPSNWLLGRIVQTHPGTDNLVRVASIRVRKNQNTTQSKIITRPITKLCRLPIDRGHGAE